VAIAAAIFAGLLVAFGTPLFLGEWLFGSIGWGILLGLLLMLAIAAAAGVKALDTSRSWGTGGPFLAAALVGVAVGVVLGLDLTNRGWTSLGDALAPGLDPSSRPLVIAATSLAVIGGLLALIAGAAAGGIGAGVAGLVGGAIGGALLGALTAIATGPRVGAAIGVAAGLIAFVVLTGVDIVRHGVDTEELKQRFWPERTIEVTKETIEWARERMPLTRKS
jgi:MFS family permease